MTPMHVAFYMHDLSGGGVERMRLALIAELRARGVEVTLIVGLRRGALCQAVPESLDLVELGCRGMLRAVLPLARVLRERRPHVLVASLDHNNVTAMLAGTLAGTGIRVVICQHNALSAERAAGWRYRAIPWLYWLLQRRAHGLVAVSQGVADDLAKVAGIPRGRITPIYNPVVTADFPARMARPTLHPWLADGGAPVLLFAGRLTAQKDPALLIEALALLTRSRPRLIVLGEGELLASLQERVRELGLETRVAFAGFQQDPLAWMSRAACLVLPSRYEGLGNVLVEALACGTPAVATDCPHGPSEILLGGQLGELSTVGDAAGLAHAIGRVLDNPPAASSLRARAAAFTAAACADAHQVLFARLTAPGRAFGLPLSTLSARAVAARVMDDAADGVRLIVTPNIDHVRLLRRQAFKAAYAAAHLVCPDGFPVLLYARLRGLKLSTRVTGCELFERLAEHPALVGKRVAVVAESQATAAALERWAATGGPSRLAVLTAPAGLAQDRQAQHSLARAITEAAPEILVITLGAPLSEVFVHEHRHVLPPCWALCLGQAVRVHLGLTERAPAFWQRAGLEWLWRLRQEPRRLAGRYLKDVAWFPMAVLADLAGSANR